MLLTSHSSRVWLTSCGVLCGGTDSIGALFEAARLDRRVIGSPPDGDSLAALAGIGAGDSSILARHQLLALAVVEQAWTAGGLSSVRNRLRGEEVKQRHSRWGCVSGSSLGGLCAMESEMGSAKKFSPYSISRWRSNAIGAVTTVRYGLGGPDFSLNAASATGAQILYLAGSLVASGMADLIVAVAADAEVTPVVRSAMERNRSVSSNVDCRPLSAGRSGMAPVEGAACVILESEAHARLRGASPLAEWIGGELANEASHLMAPDPDARVLEELLHRARACAVERRGEGSEVDWISLHATGTPRFDAAEVGCLHRVFGTSMPWISALKRTTGHALAASGLLEASLIAEGLRARAVPSWPSEIDPALGLPNFPTHGGEVKPKLSVQIGQGMGGTVVVNLLGAVEA